MLKAVVFDMDGLLVDTNPVWAGARAWMAAEAGKAWGDADNQAVMGVATQEWVDYMIDCLDVALAPDEIGPGKPAPDVYLATAERLDLDPAECACVEDSANGIISGVRAGMKVIAVPDKGFGPPPEVLEQADLVLGSLEELTVDRLPALG